MRLSALFEEFCHFLRVEKGATPATIAYGWYDAAGRFHQRTAGSEE